MLEIVQSLQKLERDASEFLWAEVLRHQDDAVRSFLLDVSILDRFTSDLCDAVTGGSNNASDDRFSRQGQSVPRQAG